MEIKNDLDHLVAGKRGTQTDIVDYAVALYKVPDQRSARLDSKAYIPLQRKIPGVGGLALGNAPDARILR